MPFANPLIQPLAPLVNPSHTRSAFKLTCIQRQAARELLTTKNIVSGMSDIIDKFNKRVDLRNASTHEENLHTWQSLLTGELTATEARDRYQQPMRRSCGRPSRMWARRWKMRMGWRERRLTAPGHFLPFEHHRMQAFREKVRQRLATENIDPRLLLNYDQIWRVKYRGKPTRCWKLRKLAGRALGILHNKPALKRKVAEAAVRSGLASDDVALVTPKPNKRHRREGMSGNDEVSVAPVVGQRIGYTCVTSLWGNGDLGPLVFVFAENVLPMKLMSYLNETYKGEIFIMTSGKAETHFMCGETTVQMWEQVYTGAFSARRVALGLTRSDARGCLMHDAFTGNDADRDGLHDRRERWLKANNASVLAGPGGWSVHGQPADCIHAYWRRLCDTYEDVSFGYDTNPLKRRRLEDISKQ